MVTTFCKTSYCNTSTIKNPYPNVFIYRITFQFFYYFPKNGLRVGGIPWKIA